MKIKVDFYRSSGKWYEGGMVEIGDARLWMGEPLRQAIVDNQTIVRDGWQDENQYKRKIKIARRKEALANE